MGELLPQERLQPSLLDRLTDDAPEAREESRDKRVLWLSQLRQSVLRDVASARGNPALAQMPITGCDGSPDFGQRLVREKRIRATVTLPSVAGPGLEWVARARDNHERPELHVTLPVRSFPELSKLSPTP